MASFKVVNVSFFNIKRVREMPRTRRGPIATAFRCDAKNRCEKLNFQGMHDPPGTPPPALSGATLDPYGHSTRENLRKGVNRIDSNTPTGRKGSADSSVVSHMPTAQGSADFNTFIWIELPVTSRQWPTVSGRH